MSRKEVFNVSRVKSPMKLLWKIVSITGLLLGIISSIIGISAYVKVDRLEDARRARDWKITVNISEPNNRYQIPGDAVMIVGKGDLRTTAAQVESSPAVNLVLEQNSVELVPFVRQVSKKQLWAVQAKPAVRQDGGFDCLIVLGDMGYEYQIIVLAVPSGSIKVDQLMDLPFFYEASNSVMVKRVDDSGRPNNTFQPTPR